MTTLHTLSVTLVKYSLQVQEFKKDLELVDPRNENSNVWYRNIWTCHKNQVESLERVIGGFKYGHPTLEEIERQEKILKINMMEVSDMHRYLKLAYWRILDPIANDRNSAGDSGIMSATSSVVSTPAAPRTTGRTIPLRGMERNRHDDDRDGL